MNRVVNFYKVIFLTFLIMFNTAFLCAQEQKILSFIVGTHASSKVTEVYSRFLEIAFAEKGYSLNLKKVPMKRETLRFLKKNPQFDSITILESPLMAIPIYPCLNKKHEILVDQITPVVERLLKEGVLEELYKPYQVQ